MRKYQYIPGSDLTPRQLERVRAVFVHRDTQEHPWNASARALMGLSDKGTPTDAEWISARAFRFDKHGEAVACLSATHPDVKGDSAA